MKWTKPKGYSNSKVDWAGSVLISDTTDPQETDAALDVLDNWRAIHKYPLHVFKVRLKQVSEKMDPEALAVQRLKRLPSILFKLKRKYQGKEPTMKLSQMQDIAGCRAVMSNMDLVKKIYKEGYIKSDLKHKKVNEKDYITHPKDDGYRSIHLIYRYKSDKEGKKEYNGLLVELQIRTKLQHQWATAVETVDFFTRQAIKSHEGTPEWVDFFKLVSSAFAVMEKTSPVPNTPLYKNELYSQIKKKEEELKVVKIMSGWTEAIKVFESVHRDKQRFQYFLLELDIAGGKLNITSYSKGREEKAILDYSHAEKRNQGKKEYDVVLVGVDAANDLRKAYPNYFADTKEFLEHLKRIIAKAN
ncbi:TPA: RelA/SpoT domain-containing protein [Candidatus Woesearchaeota archaeon]|nr:RelA/SpoT domain-containing protein [Candidatus Woesearchaeota archaeon]